MVAVNQVLHGDCLELMRDIPDKSIDMILCDLPYGTTACKWDVIIPFEPLWEQYKRIIKPNAAIVLTASQPFTSQLVMSNPKWFKYEWIFEKSIATGFLDANRKPLKSHESILVFYKGKSVYYPQFNDGEPYNKGRTGSCSLYQEHSRKDSTENDTGKRFPRSVIRGLYDKKRFYRNGKQAFKHPTQKPVALFEYLIKTYTNEGDLVLDNCAGSGTTGVAALNTGRNYILMEKEIDYFNLINDRLADALSQRQPTLEERVQWLETQVQAQQTQIRKLQGQQLTLFG